MTQMPHEQNRLINAPIASQPRFSQQRQEAHKWLMPLKNRDILASDHKGAKWALQVFKGIHGNRILVSPTSLGHL